MKAVALFEKGVYCCAGFFGVCFVYGEFYEDV